MSKFFSTQLLNNSADLEPIVVPLVAQAEGEFFAPATESLLFRLDLSGNAVKLYLIMCFHSRQGHTCYESLERLASNMRLSRRQTTRLLRELEEAALLSRQEQPGHATVYALKKFELYNGRKRRSLQAVAEVETHPIRPTQANPQLRALYSDQDQDKNDLSALPKVTKLETNLTSLSSTNQTTKLIKHDSNKINNKTEREKQAYPSHSDFSAIKSQPSSNPTASLTPQVIEQNNYVKLVDRSQNTGVMSSLSAATQVSNQLPTVALEIAKILEQAGVGAADALAIGLTGAACGKEASYAERLVARSQKPDVSSPVGFVVHVGKQGQEPGVYREKPAYPTRLRQYAKRKQDKGAEQLSQALDWSKYGPDGKYAYLSANAAPNPEPLIINEPLPAEPPENIHTMAESDFEPNQPAELVKGQPLVECAAPANDPRLMQVLRRIDSEVANRVARAYVQGDTAHLVFFGSERPDLQLWLNDFKYHVYTQPLRGLEVHSQASLLLLAS